MPKTFSIKLIDTIIGINLGLGFSWLERLHEPWQYVAFVFVYLDIVDYWIDYSPSLKKFPAKKERDIMLDIAIAFAIFLYIYAVQLSIVHLFAAFAFLQLLDYLWLLSSKAEYRPRGNSKKFIDTWMFFDLLEFITAIACMGIVYKFAVAPTLILILFIGLRIGLRILASFRYKAIYFH